MNTYKGLLMVSGAGICWATSGLFGTLLFREGIDPVSLASTRTVLATLLYFVIMLFFQPEKLKIDRKKLPGLALGGLLGLALFNIFYMNAIDAGGMSVAVALLYTSPVFALVFSRLFLGEPVTWKKFLALVVAFFGVAMVVEAFNLQPFIQNSYAVLMGLGSGLTFGMFSVFGKHLTGATNHFTTSFYLLLAGSLFLSLIRAPWLVFSQAEFTPGLLLVLGAMVVISTFFSHFLYIFGLSYLEAGRASITVAVEPAAAILMAFVFLGERLAAVQYAGVILILTAVLLLRFPGRRNKLA